MKVFVAFVVLIVCSAGAPSKKRTLGPLMEEDATKSDVAIQDEQNGKHLDRSEIESRAESYLLGPSVPNRTSHGRSFGDQYGGHHYGHGNQQGSYGGFANAASHAFVYQPIKAPGNNVGSYNGIQSAQGFSSSLAGSFQGPGYQGALSGSHTFSNQQGPYGNSGGFGGAHALSYSGSNYGSLGNTRGGYLGSSASALAGVYGTSGNVHPNVYRN